jgi:hypothetical protein
MKSPGGNAELESLGAEVPQFCYPFGGADARVAIDHADSLAKFALRVFTPLEDVRGRKAA